MSVHGSPSSTSIFHTVIALVLDKTSDGCAWSMSGSKLRGEREGSYAGYSWIYARKRFDKVQLDAVFFAHTERKKDATNKVYRRDKRRAPRYSCCRVPVAQNRNSDSSVLPAQQRNT